MVNGQLTIMKYTRFKWATKLKLLFCMNHFSIKIAMHEHEDVLDNLSCTVFKEFLFVRIEGKMFNSLYYLGLGETRKSIRTKC